MKLINLLVICFILTLSPNANLLDTNQTNYSIIEINTPAEKIYDDGNYRKVYSSFTIYDSNDKIILSSGKYYDNPAQVKLPKGVYKIEFQNSEVTILIKKIEIESAPYISLILK
ncbi:MAG: hypothetical protein U5K00_04740 [Melioribacteraceae bacterium]|nr:hypothetical protein [Melioribacteraceae bacterium]